MYWYTFTEIENQIKESYTTFNVLNEFVLRLSSKLLSNELQLEYNILNHIDKLLQLAVCICDFSEINIVCPNMNNSHLFSIKDKDKNKTERYFLKKTNRKNDNTHNSLSRNFGLFG